MQTSNQSENKTPALPADSQNLGAPTAEEESNAAASRYGVWSAFDLHLFHEGSHFRLYDKLGSRVLERDGKRGVYFSVWAPNADRVTIIGDFNDWNKDAAAMQPVGGSGVWEAWLEDAQVGQCYKYHIVSRYNDYAVDKADPFARYAQVPPERASVIWESSYAWSDGDWMRNRKTKNALDAPMSVYELHPGSWRRVPEDGDRPLSYREMAEELTQYCQEMNFTHVEFLPVMEHPYYPSWGYQCLGYFAPTSRYGAPDDFAYLVDRLHQAGIGVILDWVPSHFPSDEHGLVYFDGTHLFEHADPRQGFHPDWNSYIFNYGRNEVQSFLISSALCWLDRYHADGLRVDAVASMLYLDYSRKEGEWIPNEHGGRENLEAIRFLKRLNETVYLNFPDVQTIAEESTSWPGVSRPLYVGGLGFGMKWDMGWMHDTLSYFQKDPVYRRYHQGELTFRLIYAFHENFMLSLSHDEVVHGKGSLPNKMPGDDWQRLANVRLLFSYMYAQPGKKLLFMGMEIAQWREWAHERSLDWNLLEDPRHRGVQQVVKDLNRLHRTEAALHVLDHQPEGFEWIDASDAERSVLSMLRKAPGKPPVMIVLNCTPEPLYNYRVGAPELGAWDEIFNSDAREYGGSGQGNGGRVETTPVAAHGRYHSVNLTLPPLGAVYLKHAPQTERGG